jgi:hypothetical protein
MSDGFSDAFRAGDRVYMVGGIYRRYGEGRYIRPYGNKMCAIKVHGDTKDERNVRLTSIRKAPEEMADAPETTASVTLSKEEYQQLLQDIDDLARALIALQLRVRGYH